MRLVKELAPNATAYYLNGDLDSKAIKEVWLLGIDYNHNVFKKNPDWVKECH